jgi:hypothetical protein
VQHDGNTPSYAVLNPSILPRGNSKLGSEDTAVQGSNVAVDDNCKPLESRFLVLNPVALQTDVSALADCITNSVCHGDIGADSSCAFQILGKIRTHQWIPTEF